LIYAVALIAACIGAIYAGLRLSLGATATVVRGRIQVLATWPLTKGQFWPLLASYLLIGLIFILVIVVLFIPLMIGTAVTVLAFGEGPVDLVAGVLAGLALGPATAFVELPLSAGLAAYAYRFLRPGNEPEAVAGRDRRTFRRLTRLSRDGLRR
jgi:hypothetical protein